MSARRMTRKRCEHMHSRSVAQQHASEYTDSRSLSLSLSLSLFASQQAMAKEHEERLQREAREAEQAEVAARIASVRNKRLLHAKMRGKSLGQQLMEDGPSSAAEWVKSMKAAQKKKKTREDRLAARTAAALQEQDEAAMTADWGGSAGKRANTASSSASAYTSKDLQGLKLAHSAKSFREGQQVILTLADTSVLDDDAEQELVNVNMAEDDKRTENTRKARKLAQLASRGGNALDDEEFGPGNMPAYSIYPPTEQLPYSHPLSHSYHVRCGAIAPRWQEEAAGKV